MKNLLLQALDRTQREVTAQANVALAGKAAESPRSPERRDRRTVGGLGRFEIGRHAIPGVGFEVFLDICYSLFMRLFISCEMAITCKMMNFCMGDMMHKRPSISELEAILEREDEVEIEILPNGEVRAVDETTTAERGGRKPLTMREDLGGEYSRGISR